jgi:drug/metabolite transporter (DMT)-like permease
VGAVLFLKESTNIWTYISLLVSSLGLVFLVWGEWSANSPFYILFGLGAAFFYAIYILISRKFVKNVSPLKSSFFVQFGAGMTLGLFHFSNLERPYELLTLHSVFLICMAIICSVLPLTLFLAGLQKISSTEASVLSTTEPLFGVLIAFIVLQETLINIQIVGGVLIIGASVLMAIKSPKARLN